LVISQVILVLSAAMKIKPWFLFFLMVGVINGLYGQDNTFYRKYNLGGMQGALQLDVTDDGGFIATGQHEGVGSHGDCDIYAYKLDICGNVDWFKIYGTTAQEGGRSIFQMADGNYMVSGLFSGGSNFRAFNMKIDQNGDVIWIKRYNFEWMMYATEALNGDIISYGRNSGSLFVIRTDNLGNLIWTKQITGFGDMGLWLDELPGGDIILTSVNNSIAKDFAAARLSSVGNVIWSKAYGGSGWTDVDHTSWSCKGTLDLTDNTVVLTSPTLLGGMADENMLVTKLSLADGSVIWSKAVGGAGRDQSRDITTFPGGYAIIGHTNSFPVPANPALNIFEAMGEKDIVLFTLNTNGNLIWSRTYGGADRDKGIGVKYNLDEGFSISAFTTSPYFGNTDASFDPLFIKTDSLGIVSCQMHTPPISVVNVSLQSVNAGNYQNIQLASDVPALGTTSYTPNDQYMCQACISIPEFDVSDTTICVNDTVFFTNISTIGLTCFQSWIIENQNISGGGNFSWVFTQPGTYEVVLYSTCANSPDSMRINIHVYDPQINAISPVCEDGALVQLAANMPGGTWSGNGIIDPTQGVLDPANSGVGYINIAYTIPELCSVYDSIKVNPTPIADAGPDHEQCDSLIVELGVPGQVGQTYLWSPATNLSANNVSNPLFNYNNTGVVDVELTYVLTAIIDSSGCLDTDTVDLTIWGAPLISAGSDLEACQFETVTLSATGATNVVWTPAVQNGVPFIQNPGTIQYTVVGSDINGCVDADSVVVTIHPEPTVVAYQDTSVCEDEWIVLNSTGALMYLWSPTVSNGIPFQQQPGTQVYTVLGIDVNGCQDSDSVVVTVYPNPLAAFTVAQHDLMFNFINQSTGAVAYAWNFGDGSAWNFNENPQHFYTDLNGQSYTVVLIAESQFGCLDTTSQVIQGPEPTLLFVPNTFTPDGNEFNNQFLPVFTSGFDPFEYNLSIFDRWGELIFETNNAEFGWDGTYNGKLVQTGSYTWAITYKSSTSSERKKITGHINVLK
jgi:gliding motility-associated-like protein